MTAVVSRERARATSLTGAAGVLLLAIAFMMMVVAAPAHGPGRLHAPAKPSAAVLTSDVCHQLTSTSDSATVRGCRPGPASCDPPPPRLAADDPGRTGPTIRPGSASC